MEVNKIGVKVINDIYEYRVLGGSCIYHSSIVRSRDIEYNIYGIEICKILKQIS
jgi:hypothetical protein